MATENENHHNGHGVIAVELAAEYTRNWRNYIAAQNSEFDIQSFWFPIETIRGLLERSPEADGVRGYFGLEDPTDPTSFKLVLVSTENKIDVVSPPPVDMAAICPPICPVGSVLNQ